MFKHSYISAKLVKNHQSRRFTCDLTLFFLDNHVEYNGRERKIYLAQVNFSGKFLLLLF